MNEVWVYIEQENAQISQVSLEILCEGKKLASKLGVKLGAILLGEKVEELSPMLYSYGAERIYLVEHQNLKLYSTLPYARNIEALAKEYSPQIILFGASLVGRDLAPRVSAGLRCGLTADCTQLEIADVNFKKVDYKNILIQTRPAFGGNIIASIISPTSRPQMATVREGVMNLSGPDTTLQGELIRFDFITSLEDTLVEILKHHKEEKLVNFKDSQVIITVGAGVGNSENMKQIERLAKILNAQIGATRSAVEKGLLSRDHQIGQTGVTVRPKLYIACGVSGAIQHRVGMEKSDVIVAFNNNAEAPILKFAHYAVIGDLKQTIPMFIDAFKRRLSSL